MTNELGMITPLGGVVFVTTVSITVLVVAILYHKIDRSRKWKNKK